MKCGRYGCTLEGDFLGVLRGGEKKYWIEPQKYWIGPACAYGQSLYQRFRPGSMWLKSLLSLHLNHILTYATFLPIFSTSVQFSSVHTHSSAAIQKKKNGGRVFLFFFFFLALLNIWLFLFYCIWPAQQNGTYIKGSIIYLVVKRPKCHC